MLVQIQPTSILELRPKRDKIIRPDFMAPYGDGVA